MKRSHRKAIDRAAKTLRCPGCNVISMYPVTLDEESAILLCSTCGCTDSYVVEFEQRSSDRGLNFRVAARLSRSS